MFRWFLMLLLFYVGFHAAGQAGAVDISFNPGSGVNGHILATCVQQDDKIIIGGDFILFNGTPIRHLGRLQPDGSLDTSFYVGSGLSHSVFTVAIQPDGKILAGGQFTTYNSITANRIIRLHTDGSFDSTFHVGTGFNDEVRKIVIQPDGKILVGGKFTSFNGSTENYFIRLNSDGTKDAGFNTGNGPSNTVEDIVIQPQNDKVLICGDFTTYDNGIALRVARVQSNGSLDGSFNSVLGASTVVYALALRNDGFVAIGGAFNTYQIENRSRIALLHPDGTLNSFNPGPGFNQEVRDVTFLETAGNNIMAAGGFTTYQSAQASRIAVLNYNGAADSAFNFGAGADGALYSITQQPDSRVILSGSLTSFNGISRKGIVRIYICEMPQPDIISGSDSTLCSEMLTYSVPSVPGADSYEWTLPAGWTGASISNFITVVSNGQGGVISVRAFSDSCGYSDARTKTVYQILPPEIPLCLVTVDTASTHNILLWEKPADKSLIDSFFIYRETTTNVYTKIGAVHRDSLSAYHDDTTADPNATSYRYKISVLDICGVESALSNFHNTIHLQNLGNGNFQWTFYDIEIEPNPVTEFNIYRDNLGNGNFSQIGLVPGTNSTFTDVNYSLFPNSIYVVDVNWSRSCTPQRGPVNTTRSNIRRVNRIDTLPQPPDTTGVGLQILLQAKFIAYPNPAEDFFTLRNTTTAYISRLQLMNAIGQVVWEKEYPLFDSNMENIIPVKNFPSGIYFLHIETSEGNWRRKLAVR